MKEDLVSIVVPVYNAEKFLNETIETVKNQTYKNWELIFVDDCSKDNSVEIIKREKKDKRIKLLINEKNSGPALTRNHGIEKALGKYLCFLDADDLWQKDKLEKQLSFMKKNNLAFTYTSYEFCDEFCNPLGKKVVAKSILTYKEALKNNIISTITVMFDLTKIDKESIYMPNLKYVEDTATWWKILRSGYNAYGISNIISYYRRTSNTNSSNKFKTLYKLWKLYRKEEKLNLLYSIYCFCLKNINAIKRRL